MYILSTLKQPYVPFFNFGAFFGLLTDYFGVLGVIIRVGLIRFLRIPQILEYSVGKMLELYLGLESLLTKAV